MTKYKLVPVKPTPEMIDAGNRYLDYCMAGVVYRTMLAAAPELDVKPAAWRFKPNASSPWSITEDGYYASCMRDKGYIVEAMYLAPQPAKPAEQEPFTVLVRKHSWLPGQWEAAPCGFPDYGKQWADERINVYTAPQPAKREPLTDEEISRIWDAHTVPVFGKTGINPIVFARAIEAAHGIGSLCDSGMANTAGDTVAELEQEARLMRARMERIEAERRELLAACKAMIEWDNTEKDHAVDFYARMDLCAKAFDLTRAAIDKATGDQE